jgi:hypothetical protein
MRNSRHRDLVDLEAATISSHNEKTVSFKMKVGKVLVLPSVSKVIM